MNKATIRRLAEKRAKAPQNPAQVSTRENPAPERAQERETREPIDLSAETIKALGEAVARGFRDALLEEGLIVARMAAVDTLHSMERPATLFGRAADEAAIAAKILKGAAQ